MVQTRTQTPSPASTADPTDLYQRVNDLQRRGDLGTAERVLEDRLRTDANDTKTRYVLGLVHLRGHRVEAAAAVAEQLMSSGAAGEAFGTRLRGLVSQAREQAAARDRLLARLAALDAKGAGRVVEQLQVDRLERTILRAKLEIYQGRFIGAASVFASLRTQPETAPMASRFIDDTRAAGQAFKLSVDRLNWFLESPFGLTSCTPDGARFAALAAKFTLQEYVQVASSAFAAHPLNDRLMDVAFHAALISAPYEQLERFGDRILAGRGSLRIPFFSRTQRFWLVIDAEGRRLFTEADVRQPANVLGADDLLQANAFDLPFDRIRRLRQSAGADSAGLFLKPGSFALRLEPDGQAPYYVFMPLIHCLYGEAAQKEVTRNLGRFLLHVMAPAAPEAELADPARRTRDWLGTLATATAWSTALTDVAADAALAKREGRKPSPVVGTVDNARQSHALAAEERSRIDAIAEAQTRSRELYVGTTVQSMQSLLATLDSERTFHEIAALGAAAKQ